MSWERPERKDSLGGDGYVENVSKCYEVCATQAAILYDKYVMRHLGEALDQVRKSEYGRLARRKRLDQGTKI